MIYEGNLIGKGKKFCIIVSRYNEFITKKLLEGALDALIRHETNEKDIDIIWVPGSFEIPYAVKKVIKKNYNAIICLGTIIRGDTPHYEYISSIAARGISQAGLDAGIPVIFGIITADNLEQAINRAGVKEGNKGYIAAMSAIEMANLFSKL
jgi:6,7-dimethyl-8-ribityllumazine synthase